MKSKGNSQEQLAPNGLEQTGATSRQIKTQLLLNINHEMRTPLNGVLGMAEILARTNLDAEQMECVQTIQNSGMEMLKLIEHLLDFSKSEQLDPSEIELETLDLRTLLDDVFLEIAPLANQKQLALRYQIDSHIPPSLLGDHPKVRQCLSTFLDNAIKFTN